MSQMDHWTRPPKKRRPKKPRSELFGVFLVVALVIGVWLINGRDPGTPTIEPSPPLSPPAAVDVPLLA